MCRTARSSVAACSRCPGWSVAVAAGRIQASAVGAPGYDADATASSATMEVCSHGTSKRRSNADVESVCSCQRSQKTLNEKIV